MGKFLRFLTLIGFIFTCGEAIANSYGSGYDDGSYRQCSKRWSDHYYKKGYKKGWDESTKLCSNNNAKLYQSWYDKGHGDGYSKGLADGKKGSDGDYQRGHDDGYKKAQDQYQGQASGGRCAFVFKFDGVITQTELECSENSQCKDENRNTVDLCVLSR